jgi:hypothetical protein
VRTPAAPLTDLDVIAQRLRDELTTSALSDSKAFPIVAQLRPDGSWPDVDYADRARAHWSPRQHTRRLAQLAAAYSANLHAPDEADALEQAILSALAFWVEADPQSDNGCLNNIDTPRYLAQALLLMGDTVPKPTWERATAIVRRSGLTRTAANLTWEAGTLLLLACATRDEPMLRQAAVAIAGEVRLTTGEGLQPDFGFRQHGPQLYASSDGEAFRIDHSRYARLLAGTQYALTDRQIGALSGLIQAVFCAAGRLELDGGRAIETDAPCLLTLWRHQGGVTLSVADPTQARRRIQIQITGEYAGPGCTYDPDLGVSLIAVDLPADAPSAGDRTGQAVQIDLRAV